MTAGPARPAEPPALEADHLCRRFRGVTAVADVSLRVAAGARFGIIGPNGAGKTTLFNLLSGELRPTTGSVALFGRDITALRTYRRAALGLGRTFQITRIFSDLTVLENLTLALHGLSPSKLSLLRPWRSYRAKMAEAAELAASFGLAQRLAAPACPTCPTARCGSWRCCWPWRSSSGCSCSTSRRPGSPRLNGSISRRC